MIIDQASELKKYEPITNETHPSGIIADLCSFETENQLLSPVLWSKTVEQFRFPKDSAQGSWKGEFWGKLMRGASMIYKVTEDQKLYSVLTDSVSDLISCQNPDGSISSYTPGSDYFGWDMWCRKYIMLGLLHYLDICKDREMSDRVLMALCGHADAILNRVGEGPSKTPITSTSVIYAGLNSSSILEPFVLLYRLTNEKKYLDFSKHIIDSGFCKSQNLWMSALENKTDPYTWTQTKAYEMMSCFEGAIEYAEATGERKYIDAALNFGYRVIKSEVSVIGCCGTLTEFFDHSSKRQTSLPTGVIQETCVTVTWMKLCRRLFAHSGDTAFLDAIEQSFYNSFLGAVNTEKVRSKDKRITEDIMDLSGTLTFDSYSPLIPGTRGMEVGGMQTLDSGSFFGCCVAISPAGVAVIPQSFLWKANDEILVAFYEKGKYTATLGDNCAVTFEIDGNYPSTLSTSIRLLTDKPADFTLSFRIPEWSKKTEIKVGNNSYAASPGIFKIKQTWSDNDTIIIKFDSSIRVLQAPVFEKDTIRIIDWSTMKTNPVEIEQKPEDRNYVCYFRGPLTLGTDSRLGRDIRKPIFISTYEKPDIKPFKGQLPFKAMVAFELTDQSNDKLILTDYASTGKLWSEKSMCTAWIPIINKS